MSKKNEISIEVTEVNREQIQELIDKLQVRCRNNIISASDVINFADKIRETYSFLTKKSLAGCSFLCDPNAQSVHCRQRYKEGIKSTKFVLKYFSNGSLRLVQLKREFPSSHWIGIEANLTEIAQRHILAFFTAPLAESGVHAEMYLGYQKERIEYHEQYMRWRRIHCS